MVFRNKKADYQNNIQQFRIWYNGSLIERQTSQKYLGLIIDDKLNWIEHVDKVKREILPYLFVIRRTVKYVDQRVLWMVYNSYILPRLTYLSPIWMCAPQYKLNELKVLQNKVVKSIKTLHWRHPTHELYTENLLSLESIKRYELLLLIFKMQYHLIKINLELTTVADIHTHYTRNRSNFYANVAHSRIGSNGILHRGLTQFNSLPMNIKAINQISVFKAQLKAYLFSHPA